MPLMNTVSLWEYFEDVKGDKNVGNAHVLWILEQICMNILRICRFHWDFIPIGDTNVMIVIT